MRTGGRDAGPRVVQRPGLVVVADALGTGRRQRPGRGPTQGCRSAWAPRLGFGPARARRRGHDSRVRRRRHPGPESPWWAAVDTPVRRGDLPVQPVPGPDAAAGFAITWFRPRPSALALCLDVLFTWPVRELLRHPGVRRRARRVAAPTQDQALAGQASSFMPPSLSQQPPGSRDDAGRRRPDPDGSPRPHRRDATSERAAPPPGPLMTQPHIANASRTSVAFPPVEPGGPLRATPA